MAHKSDSVKRVYFYMEAEQHMRMKIRLDHHGIGVSEFVRAVTEGLIEKDSNIEGFMAEYRKKSKKKKHSKNKNKYSKRDLAKSETILEDLGLNGDDLEDIFDIIEESNPEI